ncbi:hypothetical protein ABTG67_18805, partial [Acinetobacter baumannii]
SGRGHGIADEGRAHEARADPGSRGTPPGRDPHRLRREAGPDPQGRGRAPGRLPRSRGARAPGAGRSQRHRRGVRRHRQGQHPGHQLLRGAEV